MIHDVLTTGAVLVLIGVYIHRLVLHRDLKQELIKLKSGESGEAVGYAHADNPDVARKWKVYGFSVLSRGGDISSVTKSLDSNPKGRSLSLKIV